MQRLPFCGRPALINSRLKAFSRFLPSSRTVDQHLTSPPTISATLARPAPSSFPFSTGPIPQPLSRDFSQFFKMKQRPAPMPTYTYDQIEKEGLTLENGINDLPEKMRDRLKRRGVGDLFPVQQATYRLFAYDQNELVVKSRTGTGKTLSFLLPLEYLIKHKEDSDAGARSTGPGSTVRAVILEPTRELAIQVQDQIDKFCSLRSSLLYGGDSKGRQCKSKAHKVQLIDPFIFL